VVENIVVGIDTVNDRGEKVLEGSAEVGQPTTVRAPGNQVWVWIFITTPAARAVWEAADSHLLTVYGFSIVDIVKDNPEEKTIHFGGIKGQAIRQRYMDMMYDYGQGGTREDFAFIRRHRRTHAQIYIQSPFWSPVRHSVCSDRPRH
jgi:hypothetical protein